MFAFGWLQLWGRGRLIAGGIVPGGAQDALLLTDGDNVLLTSGDQLTQTSGV
jgi:hypothetical protein